MERKFVYEINGPNPPEEQGLGHWGFGVFLDGNFVMKLRDIGLDERNHDRLIEEGRIVVARYGLDKFGEVTPYFFIEGSWMLQGVNVPGDSCDLSLDSIDYESLLEGKVRETKKALAKEREAGIVTPSVKYMSHNVDTKEQAFCLSSLFTNWANQANAIFNS